MFDIEFFVNSGKNIYLYSSSTGNGKTSFAVRLLNDYLSSIWYKANLEVKGLENYDIKAPTLWLNSEIDDFYKFDNSKELKDIKVKKYEHMGPIKLPIEQ